MLTNATDEATTSGTHSALSSWVLEETLTTSTEDDRFGESVALNEDLLVVGAPQYGRQDGTKPYGAAYVYRREVYGDSISWTLQDNLQGTLGVIYVSWGKAAERFGASVAVEGDRIFVGAPMSTFRNFADIPVSGVDGSVFCFEKVTLMNSTSDQTLSWTLHSKINHYISGPSFGSKITVDGNLIALIADEGNIILVFRYIDDPDDYSYGEWRLQDDVTPSGGASAAFDISAATLIVLSSGKGTIFERDLDLTSCGLLNIPCTVYQWKEVKTISPAISLEGAAIEENTIAIGNVLYSKVDGSWIEQTKIPNISFIEAIVEKTIIANDYNKNIYLYRILGEPSKGNESGESTCNDKNENCESWALLGECEKNPAYMTEGGMCLLSCGRCDLASSNARFCAFNYTLKVSLVLLIFVSLF